MADIGAPELLIILVIIVLLFGSSRLPQLARSLGAAKRELRQAMQDDDGDRSKRE